MSGHQLARGISSGAWRSKIEEDLPPRPRPDKDKDKDPDEAPETPLNEPPPLPVQDPPPASQPEGPYVVTGCMSSRGIW
jgi:hypothetical protein